MSDMFYFTADLHLGHSNIIASCNRPFKDVEEMNKTLIDNWNSRVTDRDEVYVIGDFSYRSGTDVSSMLKKMKGIKHLVIGNHDLKWMKTLNASDYFVSVEQMSFLSLDGKRIFMCHYPMMEWNDSRHGSYLVFGHIHANTDAPFWPLIANNDHMLNAGVDVNNFYPVTFEELVANNELFKQRSELE
jgi:calcineurin-like phosphoesterase family protein